MEEIKNLEFNEVLDLIENFPFKPLRNRLIISVNVTPKQNQFTETVDFDEYQYVIATGSHVDIIKPGDRILLDLEKMSVKVASEENSYDYTVQIKIKPLIINNRTYAIITDTVVEGIYNID